MVQPRVGGGEERATVREEAAGHFPALSVRYFLPCPFLHVRSEIGSSRVPANGFVPSFFVRLFSGAFDNVDHLLQVCLNLESQTNQPLTLARLPPL